MKAWTIYWSSILALLSGALLWRNWHQYRDKAWHWIGLKSLIELALLLTSAIWLPALMVAWCSSWLTKRIPSDRPGVKATLGVLAGVAFGIAAAFYMEVLVVFGIFAIDHVTGYEGFLYHWNQAGKRKRHQQPISAAA